MPRANAARPASPANGYAPVISVADGASRCDPSQITVIAIIAFRNEADRLAEMRPAARRGMVLAAVVLIWCWAFAIVQVEIVSGVMDIVGSMKR